jgi:acetolactate synthase-1/3 small subunit
VAATHDPAISQLTLVLHGDEATLEQIVRQTRKLIDVLDVSTLSLSGSESGRLVAMTAPP